MKVIPRNYQAYCVNRIYERLQEGDRYFTVVMTTGLGYQMTSLFLAHKLCVEELANIAFICKSRALLESVMHNAESIGIKEDGIDY